MTYPLSSDVTAGQPTAADHYNNLRADALRLGQLAADSANLAELLTRVEQNLTIQILSTDRLRVPATTSAPVSLIIDGYYIVKSTSNIDLSAGAKPSGSAMMWYIFAVRTPGSTTFTLSVNTSSTESSGYRLIGSFYWNGTAIEAPSIRTTLSDFICHQGNMMQFTGCTGRLSMDTSIPVKDAEGSTITLHPYKGNMISLYTPGWGWNNYPIQVSGVNPAFTPNCLVNKVYDVFAYWTGSAVALESLVWTNTTGRATALTYTEGMYLKATDLSRLYLGTYVAQANNNIRDQTTERGLWNFFNRIPKPLLVTVATANWTYAVPGTWRSPNGADALVRCVIGIAEDTNLFAVDALATAGTTYYGMVGIGDNSNSANAADLITMAGPLVTRTPIRAVLNHILAIGLHALYWIENTSAAGSVTFYGLPIAGQSQSGLTGLVQC